MIRAERRPHDLADHDLAPLDDRLVGDPADREDRPLAGVDDGGEGLDAEHPEVRDGEGRAGHLVGLERLVLGPLAEVADVERDPLERLLIGEADHRDHEAPLDRHRDADVDIAVLDEALGRVAGVDPRVRPQGLGDRVDQDVVERDLDPREDPVELLADGRSRVHEDRDRQVDVRDVPLALGHPLRDRLPHRRQLDRAVLEARVGAAVVVDVLAGRRRRRGPRDLLLGAGRRGLRRAGRLDHVRLDHPTVGSGAGDRRELEIVLPGQATGERRGRDSLVLRGGAGRGLGRRCCLRRRSFLLGRRRLRSRGLSLGRGRCTAALPGCEGRRGVLALLAEDRDRSAELEGLALLGHQLQDDAGVEGLELHRRLVGLDLGDHLTALDLVADGDVPLGDHALLHRIGESGEFDDGCHGTICSLGCSRGKSLSRTLRCGSDRRR